MGIMVIWLIRAIYNRVIVGLTFFLLSLLLHECIIVIFSLVMISTVNYQGCQLRVIWGFYLIRDFRIIGVLYGYDFRREFRDGRFVELGRLKIPAIAVTQLCAFTSSLVV